MGPMAVPVSSSEPRIGFYQSQRARYIFLVDYSRGFVPRDETFMRIITAKLLISDQFENVRSDYEYS